MAGLVLTLRIVSIVFIAVSVLHLVLGLRADALLGSPVPPGIAAEPSFDSQNRFYGVTFSLVGVVLLVAATDLGRYQAMVVAALAVLFVAGIARCVAWLLHGAPAPWLVVILVADLVLPPVLFIWLKRYY